MKLIKKDENINNLETKMEAQEEVINLIKSKDENINKYFDEIVNIHVYLKEIEKLKHQLDELNKNDKNLEEVTKLNKELEEEIKKKQEILEKLTNKKGLEEIKKLLENSNDKLTLQEKNEELNKENEKLLAKLEKEKEKALESNKLLDKLNEEKEKVIAAEKLIDKFEKQIAYYKRRGLDYPPCWSDKNGRPEYLFNININNDNLEIKKANWTIENEQEATKMMNINQLIDQEMKLAKFMQLVEPIFKDSVKEECRHFVIIKDNINNDKKEYKRKLRYLESKFYKYLE